VKHALSHSEGRVTVTIGARRERDMLSLWVRDERECGPVETVAGLGIGLANVRERLAVLFGARATLTTRADALGWTSTISLPWMITG